MKVDVLTIKDNSKTLDLKQWIKKGFRVVDKLHCEYADINKYDDYTTEYEVIKDESWKLAIWLDTDDTEIYHIQLLNENKQIDLDFQVYENRLTDTYIMKMCQVIKSWSGWDIQGFNYTLPITRNSIFGAMC